ncbi:MFS transporter [Natronoglycomyces albus]|uniref:MFS transporter n=1 Tax=Natronoglycomyces albus TaxID=2811108 RepID=A0A895XGJ3_9ACTN|nr:MFS transporter [Natronoglycomyces albus]QSB04464.1 MFS transporter [Natronoglycomyces albus]
MKLRRYRGFVGFWLASTVSDFGTYITTVALAVLIVVTMDGTAFDQGLVNAARWAPYLMFGLLAGIWVDKFRRRTVLVAGDIGRGTVLILIGVLAIVGVLNMPGLMVAVFVMGTLALVSDAAFHSFIPQLVPRPLVTKANARLEQSETVAQTTGNAVAGALVALVTAPIALMVDALSYYFSAICLLVIKSTYPDLEPPQEKQATVGKRIGEGLRWVYGHPTLGPMSVSTHIWFIGASMMGAVVPFLILRQLHLGALGLGLVLGCAGVGAVIGTTVSLRIGERWGTGRTISIARLVQPIGVAALAAAPLISMAMTDNAAVTGEPYQSVLDWPPGLMLAAASAGFGQFLFGLAMGVESPLESGYRLAVTPDRLLARMIGTMRSFNRAMIVIGAPLGGLLAELLSVSIALWIAAAVMMLSALLLVCSKFWSARVEADQLNHAEATAP